jgi:DNA helicase IV
MVASNPPSNELALQSCWSIRDSSAPRTYASTSCRGYQDTSRLQEQILLALKPDGDGLTVVGDDAQSIYSFRAAEVENILQFPSRFKTPARVVTLERNYRSTQPILDASNAVIALSPQRHAKQLWTDKQSSAKPELVAVQDESDQARWVADRVLEHREAGLKLKAQAVLFRTSHHSAALELELSHQAQGGDRHVYASLTRFMPPNVAALFEQVGPALGRDTRPPAMNQNLPTAVNLASALGQAWRRE